jgi:hypothetical protein
VSYVNSEKSLRVPRGDFRAAQPTWGHTADREGINLLKIEDNIDFGARILKNYILPIWGWEGVKRYNGFVAGNPTSEQFAEEYVTKVQRVYEFHEPAPSLISFNATPSFVD